MPLFSIIIIYYNSEDYVCQSVESVLNQKIDDYELILVNDGSTDHTQILCEEYARNDSRIKILNKVNGGISDARNTGIAAAMGEYILLIDGDDYIAEGGLESFKEKIEESNHKADYIWGRMSYFLDETGEVYQTQSNLTKDIIKGLNGRDSFVTMYKSSGRISMGVRGAFRRIFLLENDIKFPDRFFEDINVIMQVILKADYLMINPYEYYMFRNRKDSTSKKYSLRYPTDIFTEMNWWIENVIPFSDNLEFVQCVKKEADRRIKGTILKYAKVLPYSDLDEYYRLIHENIKHFQLSLGFKWRIITSRLGLKALNRIYAIKGLKTK